MLSPLGLRPRFPKAADASPVRAFPLSHSICDPPERASAAGAVASTVPRSGGPVCLSPVMSQRRAHSDLPGQLPQGRARSGLTRAAVIRPSGQGVSAIISGELVGVPALGKIRHFTGLIERMRPNQVGERNCEHAPHRHSPSGSRHNPDRILAIRQNEGQDWSRQRCWPDVPPASPKKRSGWRAAIDCRGFHWSGSLLMF